MHSWSIVFAQTTYPQRLSELESLPANGFVWIHLDRADFNTYLPLLTQLSSHPLHPQHCRDAENSEHPSFFDAGEGYQIIVWRGIAWSETDDSSMRVSIGGSTIATLIYPQLLVTISDLNDPNINRLQESILNGKRQDVNTPEELLYWLGHSIIEQFLQLRPSLVATTSHWQQLLLGQQHDRYDWHDFINFKNTLDQLHSWAEDIEDALQDWQQYNKLAKQTLLSINANDLEDHIQRAIKVTEKINSNLDTLIQLHFSSVSHRNNEILRVLAIFSVIFLPLTLITGVFGMNFDHMPILHNSSAYHITLIGMGIIAICMLIIFRIKRWL